METDITPNDITPADIVPEDVNGTATSMKALVAAPSDDPERIEAPARSTAKILLRIGLVAAGVFLLLQARPRRTWLQRVFG